MHTLLSPLFPFGESFGLLQEQIDKLGLFVVLSLHFCVIVDHLVFHRYPQECVLDLKEKYKQKAFKHKTGENFFAKCIPL